MYLPSRVTYSLRTLCVLAERVGQPVRTGDLALVVQISLAEMSNVLAVLRRGGIIRNLRGQTGGYTLVRDPSTISVADVMALFGGFIDVGSRQPHANGDGDGDRRLDQLWIFVNENFRLLLDSISVADVEEGIFPEVRVAAGSPSGAHPDPAFVR